MRVDKIWQCVRFRYLQIPPPPRLTNNIIIIRVISDYKLKLQSVQNFHTSIFLNNESWKAQTLYTKIINNYHKYDLE